MKLHLFEILCITFFLSSCYSSKKEQDLSEKTIKIEVAKSSKLHFSKNL